jgi:hypothetical protein
MLRHAGYSMMAILRMLLEFDQGQKENLRTILDTPRPDEDIYTVADKWLSTLAEIEERTRKAIHLLEEMIRKKNV